LLARTALHRALGGRIVVPHQESVAFKENSEG
jgi:hypothetical protein